MLLSRSRLFAGCRASLEHFLPLTLLFGFSGAVNSVLGFLYGLFMAYNWGWIVLTDDTAIHQLFAHRHFSRFGDELGRYSRQLWDPSAYKNAIWVVVSCLFGRRIDSHRVDASGATLHLQLTVVNAGFVIDKLSGKEGSVLRQSSQRW